MEKILDVDWMGLFVPSESLAEMVVRGTIMYLALFAILRFVMKRQTGSIGTADILLIVVIADAAQNAFAKQYVSISEGVVLVATIIFWNILLDWLAFRFPVMARIIEPDPLPIVRNGKMNRRNMRREFISESELMSQLRLNGIDDIRDVKTACVEPDGAISVVKRDGDPSPKRRKGAAASAG
jgi:uncharacterized membrane protein YcaP (DUF421 family)